MTTPFFQPGDAPDSAYRFNRDHPSRADVREFCEGLWCRFSPLTGDPHFLQQARQSFHAKTWEMMLACTLLDAGFSLQRPGADSPDIKIVADGRVVWVECVTVDLGSGGDRAERVITWRDGNTAGFYPQTEKTLLRYTSALSAKRTQFDDFRRRGVVASDDTFLVALNGAVLDDYSGDTPDPEIVKAVYPLGEMYAKFTVDSDAPAEWGHHPRFEVRKANKTAIPTTAFLDSEYREVAGLLYSRTRAWQPNPSAADYMIFIHNHEAKRPLPDGFFPFGREFVAKGGKGTWVNHTYPRKR